MGKPDRATKVFIKDPRTFADVFNYLVYDGEEVIKPENLQELDSAEVLAEFGKEGDVDTSERFRDVLKTCALMTDDRVVYMALGIEAQSSIDYGMPIRTYLYDALYYDRQAKHIRASHKKNGERGEVFTSGLHKGDKILPVITVVIYFGPEEWDGPRTLSEMYICNDDSIKEFLPEYKMNLIEPRQMKEEDFEKFNSWMGKVLKFMKAASSMDEMRKVVTEDDAYVRMDETAVNVIRQCAGVEIKTDTTAEVIDMCKAWDDWFECGVKKGQEEGRATGIYECVSDGDCTIKRGAEKLGCTVEELLQQMEAAGFKVPELV